jgi:hypothetical protein
VTPLPLIVIVALEGVPKVAPAVGLDNVVVKDLPPAKGVAVPIGILIVFDFVVAEKESVPRVAV